MTWIIKDWTGRVLWDGKEFATFEEAWEWIYVNDPQPDETSPEWVSGWYDDYYVEEKESN